MNRYHESMEHCAPPPELEEQLREAVLSAEPEPQARTAVYRPRGFFRKALLAAVLAVVLTLSVGAAVLVDWDDIFSDRFGPEGAETPMAEKAFQPVNMTSVCDDVTLTIREALVDEKSIYLILDYQLRENTQKDDIKLPMVTYYATDDIAWEDLKAAEQDTWATLDWTDPLTRIFYGKSESTLNRIGRVNGSSGLGEAGYDPATNTLSYLCNITGDADSLDFTAQPLTLLVTPPVLRVNGVDTAVTNHPAILTFQPSAVSQTLTGSYRHGGFSARAVLSPLSIYVEVSGGTAYRWETSKFPWNDHPPVPGQCPGTACFWGIEFSRLVWYTETIKSHSGAPEGRALEMEDSAEWCLMPSVWKKWPSRPMWSKDCSGP